MIKLYQFHPAWDLPNASPFCMKLETYLRMAGIPYEVVPDADIRKAPKGKMPYIEHDGKVIGDSGLIIDYLKGIYGDKLDGELSLSERGTALAVTRLFEEHLYWVILYSRWAEEDGWRGVKSVYFGFLPPVLRDIIPPLIRRGVLRDLRGHGMGRHQREEIYRMGRADLLAAAHILGDRPFFTGSNPAAVDATAYAFLANILWCPLDSPLKECAQEHPNLSDFCRRMKERF